MRRLKISLLLLVAFFVTSNLALGQINSGSYPDAPSPILVQSQINSNHSSGCNFLVLEDNLPWGNTAITDILSSNGETFSIANSATFPGLDFSMYDVIIVAGDQNATFQAAFVANFPKFVNFVTAGGSLEVHAATCGWNSPCGLSVTLPGGVYTVEQYDTYNNVVDPGNPIVFGIPNPFFGSYASHGYFENLQPATNIITTTQSNDKPTGIQYQYGSGIVTASTAPYSYGYEFGETSGQMLINNLNYSCEHAIDAETPISRWALGIGIALILGLAILRYRRII